MWQLALKSLCADRAKLISNVLGVAFAMVLANLLLLTYSGLDQLVPALALALFARRWVGLRPILAGLVVGEVVVVVLTFGPYAGTVNEGLVALVPNLVGVALGALLERRRGGAREGTPRADRATESSPRPAGSVARGEPSVD